MVRDRGTVLMALNDSSKALLRQLLPIRELAPERLDSLGQAGRTLQLARKERLDAEKEYRWLLYLLEGEVRMFSDGAPMDIQAGSERARLPLFSGSSLKEHALALTETIRLLRLDRKLYEVLRKEQSDSGYEVRDFDLGNAEGEVLAEVYAASANGKLVLPALPEVAVRIQRALKDPNVDVGRLARMTAMDIGVSGGLLRAANSALYGGSRPVATLGEAIIRLGMDVTRRLVVTIAMQQVFRTESPALQRRMRALWDRSVQVSALSFVLARRCAGFDPEEALLAGLLHDVGVVPILDHLGRYHAGVENQELDIIIGKLRGLVGELVIGYWGLGDQFRQVVRESGEWQRDPGAQPDYCDLVLVARLYHMHQSGRHTGVPDYAETPAFRKLGLDAPNEHLQLDVIEAAKQEIQGVMAMLNATGSSD